MIMGGEISTGGIFSVYKKIIQRSTTHRNAY